MTSRHIVGLLRSFLVMAAALSGGCNRGPVLLDAPIGSDRWTVLDCTQAKTCAVTIQVTPAPTECLLASVPDVIDVSSKSPRIDWTLQSASGKRYSFGWRSNGKELREGVRIRESDVHDEDDHDPTQAGPTLSGAFDTFNRTSDSVGYTGLKTAELQKPAMHRIFYYRIHVDQTDADGSNLIHCKPLGPMIINRG